MIGVNLLAQSFLWIDITQSVRGDSLLLVVQIWGSNSWWFFYIWLNWSLGLNALWIWFKSIAIYLSGIEFCSIWVSITFRNICGGLMLRNKCFAKLWLHLLSGTSEGHLLLLIALVSFVSIISYRCVLLMVARQSRWETTYLTTQFTCVFDYSVQLRPFLWD